MMVSDSVELPAPANPMLSRDDVHAWFATLEQPTLSVQRMAEVLSQDELGRADRFHFERDRRRFIVGRGLLRRLLSLYLDIEPEQLRFRYGEYGKPYLAESNDCALRFNLAHSHELAVYAFTLGREVGVDLEYIQDIPEMEQIAARFFSKRENDVLKSLPVDQRQEAFFNCWTRKEAYIKAIGDGLTYPLDQFDVSLTPGEPARLLNVEGNAEEVSRWKLRALTPEPAYRAALAVEGHGWRLQSWQWPDE
ncbi:4'-phosphopantetheinyl transferase family protein [Candidatus Poribacteria bacterium]